MVNLVPKMFCWILIIGF